MSGEETAYAALFAKIERERGFRANLYRQKCLRRRVAVRMRARGLTGPREYSALLDADPGEYERLLRVLTINVSKFFRNPETWNVMRRQVLPELLSGRDELVLWSAGSAAGEEAYSLAISVLELLGGSAGSDLKRIRIIGTDIDGVSLDTAVRGEYTAYSLEETPAEIRQRWFSLDGRPRVKEAVRSLVEFRRLDILGGRPAFDADLVLCRNLLIYLDRDAQRRVFETMVEVIRPGGFLVLGRVEILAPDVRPLFEAVDLRERIYRRL